MRIKIPIALLCGIVTTLGQSHLLHLIAPAFMAKHELWTIASLLVFNCGLAGLVLWRDE